MRNEMTVKELCEKLWQFERDLNLLDLEIRGVRFWELIRYTVFVELSKKLVGFGQAHTSKNSMNDKLMAIRKVLINSISKNPFRGNYKVDFLVYDHMRKMNVEGNNIDIYTNDFVKSHDDKKFEVIEAPYHWEHITSKVKKNIKYLDHEILTVFLKKKMSSFRLENEERSLISELQNELDKRFKDVGLDLGTLISKYLLNFIHRFEYHKKLFQKRKPNSIYIVVSYGKIPIIAAAKDLGVKVIEFQHGVITNYHFAYNFSDPTKKLKYFPDKLLTFGGYWAKAEGFPRQTEIEIYGFPYLNQQLERYKGTPKKKNQILFLSQGPIGKELSKWAKEVAESMPDYHFIYKLHPGEYDRWRSEYSDLIKASHLENFVVIDNNDKNLYSYLAESEFQVGVNSTALFEGLTLDCKTILINLNGIEYMNDLIDQKIVMVAAGKEDFENKIKFFNVQRFNKDYFFK